MAKRILALLLGLLMFSLAGCLGNKDEELNIIDDTSDVSSEEEPAQEFINPLTGLKGFDEDKVDSRPVAIMINNISTAQNVQTGVNAADIVYETEVEGGITRLMAVYKDISAVGQIGTIRSARYPYVDLALGHNAIYIHCGADPTYCAPHLKDINEISIDTGKLGAKRISNGLSKEHTLYSFGNTIADGLKDYKFKLTTDSTPWVDFANEEETVSYEGSVASKVSVAFSNTYKTVFNYDVASGTYVRSFGNTVRKDYVTGETTTIKNVFVLLTTISNYPDGKHRKVDLSSGEGYYATNGTYTHITWTKGGTGAFKFKDDAGNSLKVSAGKSWVCIADKNTSQPVFE